MNNIDMGLYWIIFAVAAVVVVVAAVVVAEIAVSVDGATAAAAIDVDSGSDVVEGQHASKRPCS